MATPSKRDSVNTQSTRECYEAALAKRPHAKLAITEKSWSHFQLSISVCLILKPNGLTIKSKKPPDAEAPGGSFMSYLSKLR